MTRIHGISISVDAYAMEAELRNVFPSFSNDRLRHIQSVQLTALSTFHRTVVEN